MKKENIAIILGIVGGLGLFSGMTYDAWAIIISLVVVFLLSAWLYTKFQRIEASNRTPSNPITSLDQNAMATVSFIAVFVFYALFFYIGTLF